MTKEFGFSGAIAKLNKISSNAKSINSNQRWCEKNRY